MGLDESHPEAYDPPAIAQSVAGIVVNSAACRVLGGILALSVVAAGVPFVGASAADAASLGTLIMPC